jgi:hypothetical protein
VPGQRRGVNDGGGPTRAREYSLGTHTASGLKRGKGWRLAADESHLDSLLQTERLTLSHQWGCGLLMKIQKTDLGRDRSRLGSIHSCGHNRAGFCFPRAEIRVCEGCEA